METTGELYERYIMASRKSLDKEKRRCYRILAYCFHPDGYTRERALRTVSDVSDADILWIAYNRLCDWVAPIRELAAELIERRLPIADGKEMKAAFPYVVACARSLRVSEHFGDRYVRAFEAALIRLELWSDLHDVLLEGTQEEACFAIRVMLRDEKGRQLLCAYMEALPDPARQGKIFTMMAEAHPECLSRPIYSDDEITVLSVMLASAMPANRLNALLWIHHYAADSEAIHEAQGCLEDKSSVVRGQACTMLEQRCPDFNAHIYYTERLKTSPTAAVIGGFADTGKAGDETDINTVKELLSHAEEGNRITPALLRALHLLIPAAYPDPLPRLILPYLGSSLPKVPQTAAGLLMLRGQADHEEVYAILETVDAPTATLHLVRVLGTVGSKWDRLIYLLRVLILLKTRKWPWRYKQSECTARSLLDRWLATANRSFTPLTPEIVLTVEGLLSLCEERRLLDEVVTDRVRFYLK